GDVLAEDDGAAGARRRELNDAEVVFVSEVGVEAPAKLAPVEVLGAIDIRDGDDDDFELQIDDCGFWSLERSGFSCGFGLSHGGFLSGVYGSAGGSGNFGGWMHAVGLRFREAARSGWNGERWGMMGKGKVAAHCGE